MKKTLHHRSTFRLSLFLCLFTLNSCQETPIIPDDYSANAAANWNEIIMSYAKAEDGLLTLKGVRTEAMTFIAMHNALNTIVPIYSTYEFENPVLEADPIAAINQAAYEVVAQQYPDKADELSTSLQKALASVPEGALKDAGIELGKLTAKKVLSYRTNDNWDGEADYTWHPMAPGVYAEFNEHSGTPEGFIFGAGWAAAEPFMLESQDHFRSPPPPDINSEDYTNAFNEVKTVGSQDSEVRTKDQAHLAMWWKDFVEHSHNRLARALIAKEQLNLWEAVRTYALLNMTVYDAYINVFDNKFHYNHWRPFTAIRWAANDENPNTIPDEQWNNLHHHTYAFPSYPSAHGTASSAAMRVLANTLGKGDNYAFTMETKVVESAGPFSDLIQMDPPTRSFESFTEAGLEASMSRVYLGIHFRYDSEEGHRLGNAIGDYANTHFLRLLEQ